MGSKAKISIGLITAALAIATPFIHLEEGESLKAYEDVAGVWTICHGVTSGVTKDMTKTKAECDELTNDTIAQFMTQVSDLIQVPVTPNQLAAHVSFSYNIGMGAYRQSLALKYTNQGKAQLGCLAMLNWIYAGGKDCRLPESNCSGLITRRNAEIKLCMEGL